MKVDVVGTTLVAPREDTPRRELWLSNLDLAVPKTHTPLVYYYPAPTDGGGDGAAAFFAPERLRAALGRALVPFYPLAGRLGVGDGGRLHIDCNAQGALFAVARADFAGDDGYEPSPEVRRMFVPSGDPPCVMAMFQVESEKGSQAARGQLMPESDLWVVSWLGMPMYDADFGWGTPRFVAPAQMFGSGTAYVTQRANMDDGVAVLFGLEPEYLQCFEKVFYGSES